MEQALAAGSAAAATVAAAGGSLQEQLPAQLLKVCCAGQIVPHKIDSAACDEGLLQPLQLLLHKADVKMSLPHWHV